jgi:hypothetical protein
LIFLKNYDIIIIVNEKERKIKMGYYSNFFITVIGKENKIPYNDVAAAISEITNFNLSRIDIVNKPTEDDNTAEMEINDVKWYYETKDMKEVAKLFPNFYFLVERIGEIDTDQSLEVFYGDKYEIRETVVISPYEQFSEGGTETENELNEIAIKYYNGCNY